MTDLILADYPVVIELPVLWGDMDAYQHVNNTVYFRWFESGRIAYFQRLEMMRLKEQDGIGPILAHADCRFRIPLTFPDDVRLGTRIAALGEDRFLMEYAAVSQRHAKIAAQGSGLVVMYDYTHNRKAAVPAELRRAIIEVEGRELPDVQRRNSG